MQQQTSTARPAGSAERGSRGRIPWKEDILVQQKVCELVKDQRFEGFLLVRSADQRTGGNGAKYLDLNLADRTGEVNAKVWDGNAQPPCQFSSNL